MYIKTRGKPTKVTIKFCKEAIQYFAKFLLKDQKYHEVTITIDFNKNNLQKKSDFASCEYFWTGKPVKEFTIVINENLGKLTMLKSLAHEMVHVKQYVYGELKDYLKVNKISWKGQDFHHKDIDYWLSPWEVEAHGIERGLYAKYMQMERMKRKEERKKRGL